MADHMIIASVTAALMQRLRQGLCPAVIKDAESIGVSNETQQFNHILTLCLYDITKSDWSLLNCEVNAVALKLAYMLVASGKGDPHTRALEEQRILGCVVKILADEPVIDGVSEIPAVIEMSRLSLYDKNSLMPKRLALFYGVAPVLVPIDPPDKGARVMHVGGE